MLEGTDSSSSAGSSSAELAVPGERPPPLLQAIGLCRIYRQGTQRVEALSNVNIDLQRSEFVVLTGASGSGKSTLLHVLSGLDRPDTGEVVLEEERISQLPERQLAVLRRRKFGFLLQFYNLLPTLSAEENVAFPLLLDSVRDALPRARRCLEEVGLADRARHKPHELSGGEQQRVGLARALVAAPAVVFADEPTGNLDSKTGAEILRLLRRAADAGQTIAMATHDPKAASYADRSVTLADGRCVASHDLARD